MNCRKVCRSLSAYMDGELPGVEHRQIHDHLKHCSECATEYRDLLQTKRLLANMRVRAPHTALPERIIRHIAIEESRRPASLSRRIAEQVSRWWRNEAGSPRVLAALSCALLAAFVLPRTTLLHLSGGEKRGGVLWVKGEDEAANVPRVPVVTPDFGAFTHDLRPYPAPISPQWNAAPWQSAAEPVAARRLLSMPAFSGQKPFDALSR